MNLVEGEQERLGHFASGRGRRSLPSARRWCRRRVWSLSSIAAGLDGRPGGAVSGDAVEGDGAVEVLDGDPSSWVQVEGPAAFVDEVVVPFADRHQVVAIGLMVH